MGSDSSQAGRASGSTSTGKIGDKDLAASVLILDDEPGMRSFLQRGLARLFALVEVAADTATAQELIRRCHFDLLIADIRLPGRTGISEALHDKVSRPSLAPRMWEPGPVLGSPSATGLSVVMVAISPWNPSRVRELSYAFGS